MAYNIGIHTGVASETVTKTTPWNSIICYALNVPQMRGVVGRPHRGPPFEAPIRGSGPGLRLRTRSNCVCTLKRILKGPRILGGTRGSWVGQSRGGQNGLRWRMGLTPPGFFTSAKRMVVGLTPFRILLKTFMAVAGRCFFAFSCCVGSQLGRLRKARRKVGLIPLDCFSGKNVREDFELGG